MSEELPELTDEEREELNETVFGGMPRRYRLAELGTLHLGNVCLSGMFIGVVFDREHWCMVIHLSELPEALPTEPVPIEWVPSIGGCYGYQGEGVPRLDPHNTPRYFIGCKTLSIYGSSTLYMSYYPMER